jgi:hypothetical protein
MCSEIKLVQMQHSADDDSDVSNVKPNFCRNNQSMIYLAYAMRNAWCRNGNDGGFLLSLGQVVAVAAGWMDGTVLYPSGVYDDVYDNGPALIGTNRNFPFHSQLFRATLSGRLDLLALDP